MPAWPHLHPAIVHFPIALLLVAPLLVILGFLWPSQRSGIHACALALLTLGTIFAAVAVATGLATAVEERTPELLAALEEHERLGKWTALCYAGLTAVLAVFQFLPRHLGPRRMSALYLPLYAPWLAAILGAGLLLIRTGHLGGRMVHELGVHAAAGHSGQPH